MSNSGNAADLRRIYQRLVLVKQLCREFGLAPSQRALANFRSLRPSGRFKVAPRELLTKRSFEVFHLSRTLEQLQWKQALEQGGARMQVVTTPIQLVSLLDDDASVTAWAIFPS